MRRVRQVSITRYIAEYLLLLTLALTFLMILFVNVLADRVIYYDIQSTLIRELAMNNKNIYYEDEIIKPNEDFKYIDDGIYFQIVKEDGGIIMGESPQGVELTEEDISQRLKMKKIREKEYYVISRVNKDLTREAGQIIYNRCIVKKEDIDSKYQIIKYTSYASIPVLVIFILSAVFGISKKISEPLKQMSKTAESIGRYGELSKRMEYDGKITELGVLAATNNRMLASVEDMFETQKRFSSDVAHELRTPLAVLLAQCEYAKEYTSNKEEFEEAIDVIYRQAQKTNAVITQLLNLNRLESNRVVLEMEEVDLDEIICSICDDIELKEKDNVRFELKLSGIKANLDIGFMFILLQNLIQNAVKYSESPAVVKISTEKKGNEVFVRVEDFGCGINEEDLQHIFVPFYRVEKARNSEGFGLGLSLANRIAQIHGGRIEVESEPGKGSIFTLVLPEK